MLLAQNTPDDRDITTAHSEKDLLFIQQIQVNSSIIHLK